MKALMVIDMLRDFIEPGAPLEVPAARNIINNIKREIENARSRGYAVIYLKDAHDVDDPEFTVWPRHAVKGTKGAEIINDLSPERNDTVIDKLSYSGFYKTPLERKLRAMGVETLVITGVVTNICVLYTSVDAMMRGFNVEVPSDCVAALDEEDHKFALKQIKEVLKPRRL